MPLKWTPARLLQEPHRRLNALTGEWILVSPHRTRRPWQGREEAPTPEIRLEYDPSCYLCPGNVRAGGTRNPPYEATYVFKNDFPALLEHIASEDVGSSRLLAAKTQAGTCRVICYSPRHDLTMAQLSGPALRRVVDTWAAQEHELSARWHWVQIFENKGEMMGCSNPHPHGQIWASDSVPTEMAKELACQRRWFSAHASPLLLDYLQLELGAKERVIVQNRDWVAVVPWWAEWPFEILVLPRRSIGHLYDLTDEERDSAAGLLGRVIKSYDALFGVSFPYSFGWHGTPGGEPGGAVRSEGATLHAHFYPPLLRSATVRKFMVGYEMLAEVQRDITPEQAAEQLRASAATSSNA